MNSLNHFEVSTDFPIPPTVSDEGAFFRALRALMLSPDGRK
jgi:hypothetical protein